jgi:hypothetical protein
MGKEKYGMVLQPICTSDGTGSSMSALFDFNLRLVERDVYAEEIETRVAFFS